MLCFHWLANLKVILGHLEEQVLCRGRPVRIISTLNRPDWNVLFLEVKVFELEGFSAFL